MTSLALPRAEVVMGRAGGENFPVASLLFPAAVRRDLLAVYGFARLVDEVGDEAPGDRSRLLDLLEEELLLVYRGGEPSHPIVRRLARTVRTRGVPPEPFRDLIEANRLDQRVQRYPTFEALLGYCALSANPVGRIVLHVLGAWSPERARRSDDVCTGLQLVEHWQDIAEDLARGRIYVPAEDLARFGVDPADLGRRAPTPAFRELMAFEVSRARSFLLRGAPLARDLGGRAGLGVAAFVAGGLAALEAIERAGYDVLGRRPRPGRGRRLRAFLAVLARGAGTG
jgi:squalene synthase HpnC